MAFILPGALTPAQRATLDRAHRLKVRMYDKGVQQAEIYTRLKGGQGMTQQYFNAILNRRTIGSTTDALLDEAEAILGQILKERERQRSVAA